MSIQCTAPTEIAACGRRIGFATSMVSGGLDGVSLEGDIVLMWNSCLAAMPSLHFGYSFLVGLTIAAVPLRKRGRFAWRRLAIVGVGMIYPAIILTAIVATANHFVLDAVAGACACLIAWHFNDFLLNLVPLEDYFLALVRIHKP